MLMEYGLSAYKLCTLEPENTGLYTYIRNGAVSGFPGAESVRIPVETEGGSTQVLLRSDETPDRKITLERNLDAPVQKGETLGYIGYSIDGMPVAEFRLTAGCTAEKRTFQMCLKWTVNRFLFQE